jgi:hypothetical protein
VQYDVRHHLFDAEGKAVDRRTVEMFEDELCESVFADCKVEIAREPTLVAQAKLAQRRTSFEHKPELEEAGDVEVMQCVVLRDVDKGTVAERTLPLAVPEEEPLGYHGFTLGTSNESMRL